MLMDMIICYTMIHERGCFRSEIQVSRVEANDTVYYIFIKESIFYIMHLYTNMDIIFKQGLRKRNDFDKIVDYLQFHQEKIRYPDRTATNQVDELVDQLSFSDFYNAEKEMKQQKVFNMLMKADKQTQTKFFEDSGITFNINNFRDEYDNKLDSGDFLFGWGAKSKLQPR